MTLTFGMFLFAPGPGLAQSDGSPGASSLQFQGSVRTRVEGWNWFEGEADHSYVYSGSIIRFGIGQQTAKRDWKLEFSAPILLGLPDDAIAPAPQGPLGLGPSYFVANKRSRNAAMVFPKQGYLRFHHLGAAEAHSLRLGRFEFLEGSEVTPQNATLAELKKSRVQQRLIGNFGFSHVGRSFDGFHYAYDGSKDNLTLVGAFATRGVFQVDGWAPLKAGLGYAAYTRSAGMARSAGEWRLFGAYYHDWRRVVKTDNRPGVLRQADLSNVRIGTFGAHYVHSVETTIGNLDLLVWGNIQAGRWGQLRHRAGAVAAEAGFQPAGIARLKPWIRGGFFHGSGDNNPGDGTHKTFFQLLPTARVYARFPFFNLMNNQDFSGSLLLRPHQRLSLRSDIRALRLANRNDLWYAGGGAFQPWSFGYAGRPSLGGRGLATLYDVSADVKATSSLSMTLYFGYANGKSVLANIYPGGKNGRFGYFELTHRF